MGELLEGLGFQFPAFIWAVVNFLILVFLLKKFLFKPVLNMLDERKSSIEKAISDAETAKVEAEKLRAEYEAQIAKARQEAHDLVSEANKVGEQMKKEIVAKAQEEATKASQRAQEDIEREKGLAIQALRDEVATLAVLAAGKIIGKTLTKEDHEKLVKDFVAEVGDLKC